MEAMQALSLELLRLALIAAGLFYAVVVLLRYARSGAYQRPKWNEQDFVRSTKELGVWLGVCVMAVLARVGRPLINTLSEASADVGEWAISRHQSRAHANTRSR